VQLAIPFLEGHPSVARYSWYAGRTVNVPNAQLFSGAPGNLTTLGKFYVSAPPRAAIEVECVGSECTQAAHSTLTVDQHASSLLSAVAETTGVISSAATESLELTDARKFTGTDSGVLVPEAPVASCQTRPADTSIEVPLDAAGTSSHVTDSDFSERDAHWFLVAVFNPIGYVSRMILLEEFMRHIILDLHANVILAELIYDGQSYVATAKPPADTGRVRYVQFRASSVVWEKERMLNAIALELEDTLPPNAKYITAVDGDLTLLRNDGGPADTIVDLIVETLQRHKVAQTWTNCKFLKPDETPLYEHRSFASHVSEWQATHSPTEQIVPVGKWEPGFAWSFRLDALRAIGGFFDVGIVGSGDRVTAYALCGLAELTLHKDASDEYRAAVLEYQKQVQRAQLGDIGVVPITLLHHWHGAPANRQFRSRQSILARHSFNPARDLVMNRWHMWELKSQSKPGFQEDIIAYFRERKEDATLGANSFSVQLPLASVVTTPAVGMTP
jgi:hypothetical protein